MLKVILYIISVIVNFVYFFVMRIDLYTDRFHLPDGEMGEHTRSPIDSLYSADKGFLFYIELLFMAISVITSIVMLFGVKNNIVRIVQIVSTVASTLLFIIIMVYAGNVHLNY